MRWDACSKVNNLLRHITHSMLIMLAFIMHMHVGKLAVVRNSAPDAQRLLLAESRRAVRTIFFFLLWSHTKETPTSNLVQAATLSTLQDPDTCLDNSAIFSLQRCAFSTARLQT